MFVNNLIGRFVNFYSTVQIFLVSGNKLNAFLLLQLKTVTVTVRSHIHAPTHAHTHILTKQLYYYF